MTNIQDFIAQKDKEAAELSAIVGFDIRLMQGHQVKKSAVYLDVKYIEQNFIDFQRGQPIYFGFHAPKRGALSFLCDNFNPEYVLAFKKNDQWHMSTGSFTNAVPVTDEQLRQNFMTTVKTMAFDPETTQRQCASNRPSP